MSSDAPAHSSAFPQLQGHSYMSLTTFRKTGVPVATPVWFVEIGKTLYVTTNANSGKVKRLRNNAQVTVAPCDVRGNLLGEAIDAMGRVIQDRSEAAIAARALDTKYGLQKRLFDLFGAVARLIGRSNGEERVYLAIEPASKPITDAM